MNQITRFDGTEYAFLSNFYPSPITYCGVDYPTVEHAYQALKTEDRSEHDWVRSASTPGEAKKRGRQVTVRPLWEQNKVSVMHHLVQLKFQQNPDLVVKLLSTGDAELVEGNHWNDTFWGVCRGEGSNWLGKILMQVRSHFVDVMLS